MENNGLLNISLTEVLRLTTRLETVNNEFLTIQTNLNNGFKSVMERITIDKYTEATNKLVENMNVSMKTLHTNMMMLETFIKSQVQAYSANAEETKQSIDSINEALGGIQSSSITSSTATVQEASTTPIINNIDGKTTDSATGLKIDFE